jgi:group I intron endonuclease
MGWIYQIVFPNNKLYKGQTWNDDPKKRWSAEKRQPHGRLVYAFKKYGVENCKFEALYEISYKTHGYRWKEFLDFWERYEIAEDDTLVPNGYNILEGGRNAHTRPPLSEETKDKLRQKAIGRKASDETKLKLKKTPAQKEWLSIINTGTKQSQETRDKKSVALKDKPKTEDHRRKIGDAHILYNQQNDKNKKRLAKYNTDTKSKKISQFTKEGELVTTYESLAIASQRTGINKTGISKCALGNKKFSHSGGFVWKYI